MNNLKGLQNATLTKSLKSKVDSWIIIKIFALSVYEVNEY